MLGRFLFAWSFFLMSHFYQVVEIGRLGAFEWAQRFQPGTCKSEKKAEGRKLPPGRGDVQRPSWGEGGWQGVGNTGLDCQPCNLRAVKGCKRRLGVKDSASLEASQGRRPVGEGFGQCGVQKPGQRAALGRSGWSQEHHVFTWWDPVFIVYKTKGEAACSRLRIVVEASLEVVNPVSRNVALRSFSNSMQMFLVYFLYLGWPFINKFASHAHQLLPLCDGDNYVLLCCYQRQTQQIASEQSWILSWEGEQWRGSGPAFC